MMRPEAIKLNDAIKLINVAIYQLDHMLNTLDYSLFTGLALDVKGMREELKDGLEKIMS